MAAAARLRTLNEPMRFTRITNSNFVRSMGSLSLEMVRPGWPRPAEFTSARSGPISDAATTAVSASSVLVTSQWTKRPPSSVATAWPRSSFRSAMTTRLPAEASCRALASPMPDAPPVTTDELPSRFMRGMGTPGLFGWSVVSAGQPWGRSTVRASAPALRASKAPWSPSRPAVLDTSSSSRNMPFR